MNLEEAEIIKIAPVIIQNGKFLIVRGKGKDFWKNVGGVLEEGETEIECLAREALEELSVEFEAEPEYYFSTPVTETVTKPKRSLVIKLYKAKIKGDPNPCTEIEELHWLSKEEFDANKFNLAYQISDCIVPRLIKDNLLK